MPSSALSSVSPAVPPCSTTGPAGATAASRGEPIVRIDDGLVRGEAVDGGTTFRGLPYAAPPTGRLRWRPPQPAHRWRGVREATGFAPSCPQQAGLFAPPGEMSEDCLYLNVYTPARPDRRPRSRPVLVWIHGGGLATDGARNYDPTQLASEGTVVVTVNYRLGALGFLAHPALASRPGGPSGNYGLMDQQAALRWVQRNIRRVRRRPAQHHHRRANRPAACPCSPHLVSRDSRGLFQRAIVQSGAFALTQVSLADAEAFGQAFASNPEVGCADQTARCLRGVAVEDLVGNFPTAAIPGVVDGKVLTESIGTAPGGRPVRPGADPQRQQPPRGAHLRRRTRRRGQRRDVRRSEPARGHRRELPAADRVDARCVRGPGRGDRGRVPDQLVPVGDGGVQRAGRRRQLRLHRAAGERVDICSGADVRLRVQRRHGTSPLLPVPGGDTQPPSSPTSWTCPTPPSRIH